MHTEHTTLAPESQDSGACGLECQRCCLGPEPHLRPSHKEDFKTSLLCVSLTIPAAPELQSVTEWFLVCW